MSDNPYPNASDTMHYELHTAWDEGYAEGHPVADRPAWPLERCGHGAGSRGAVVVTSADPGTPDWLRAREAQHAVASRWPILARWAAGGTIEAHELVTDLRDALDFLGGENAGVWPDQSAQHAVLLDEIRECRQRTVAEIVEALRERCPEVRAAISDSYYNARDAGRTMEDAADEAAAAVVGQTAVWIESRFGGEESDD